ncbi:MAG: alpha/beta hydrolase-fold protein [Bacteroidales bacterium]
MNVKSNLVASMLVMVLFGNVLTLTISAQQTGNIVEYFGRETVEEIEEGNVVHVFSKGLFLPIERFSGGLFTTEDHIAWQLANGTFTTPVPGQAADNNSEASAWNAIETNEEEQFQNRQLRSSYVYTSIESSGEEIVMLDARGHTRVYINGLPYEGDHYDFGYTLIPFKLKKGLNEFIYTPGRFGRVAAKIVAPSKPVQLTRRDLTLPGLINGESSDKWAAIRVINASEKDLGNLNIECVLETGESAFHKSGNIMALSVRKLRFLVPSTTVRQESGSVKATVILTDNSGREIDRTEITLQQQDADKHHERTFISGVDGSVQYYSVAPSTQKGDGQALILSVHGAGVEARNQARAYRQKDWAHIVAPTNRRPFGFNWEEWGSIDAMEVFDDAKKVFKTKDEHSYLTGHSMGGHGTWYLGVTYPDRFAAIAPCASYPDIMGYRRGASNRFEGNAHFDMITRGANPGRTLSLKRNFLQSGIYILHGDADRVVDVEQARFMRETLGGFHPNFVYYEYPDGSHWYGDHSVDWHPIFDYFKWQSIPAKDSIKHIEFHTASPAVSATNYWIRINQQEKHFEFSSVVFDMVNDSIKGSAENVNSLTFLLSEIDLHSDPVISIGDFTINAERGKDITLQNNGSEWIRTDINTKEKYAKRSGGFKQAFRNNMVFVYATRGSREENQWYRNKARFDAEAFLYKANGSVEIVSDRDFRPQDYPDRNVILYGNSSNNRAWNSMLGNVPVVIRNGEIEFGSRRTYKGDDLGAFFIFPRTDSETASVGVVGGTGIKGMKAAFANDYFSGITGFPDLMIFNSDMLKEGVDGIIVTGFFGNDWSVEKGDFSY